MKGSIYAIRSHQTPNIYIGSTINKYLSGRLGQHKYDYKEWINGTKNYITSYEILQFEDAYIELIEIFEFNDKTELRAREGHYIRTMDCVNKVIVGRTQQDYRNTHKEQRKQYDIDNKDKIKEQHKEYAKEWYDENKKRILEERKQYANNNKDKIKEYQMKYKNDNREKINKNQNEKYKQKKLLEQIIIE
jgi:hypothetical protein